MGKNPSHGGQTHFKNPLYALCIIDKRALRYRGYKSLALSDRRAYIVSENVLFL